MQKWIQLLLLFLLLPMLAFSQGRVSGVVADAAGNPLEGVTAVFAGRDTVALITGKDGRFSQELSGGNYQLHLRHLGYEEQVVSVQNAGDTNLGSIVLQRKAYDLKSVTVQGKFLQKRGSGYTMHMRGNPIAEGKSLGELLTKEMPNVSPDLRIEGNEAVSAVYVNGRKLNMPKEQLFRYLQSLPAESVEKIKVQAGNTIKGGGSQRGGAIHISTRIGDSSLFFGTLNASLSVGAEYVGLDPDATFSLGYSGRKVSVNTSLMATGAWDKTNEQTLSTAAGKWEELTKTTGFSNLDLMWDNSVVYEITDRQQIGLGLNLWYMPFWNERMQTSSADGLFLQGHKTYTHEEDVFVSYELTFGKNGNRFQAVADFLNNQDGYAENSLPSGERTSGQTTGRQVFSGKAEFGIPLGEVCELTAGADYLYFNGRQTYQGLVRNPPFTYKESTAGAYAEFFGEFWDCLDITAGFRYEWAMFRALSDNTAYRRKDGFHDYFPTLDIGYNFSKPGFSLNGGYLRSVSRPAMNNYTPFVYTEGEHVFYTGGGVAPEYQNKVYLTQMLGNSHSVGLSYVWSNNSPSAFYRWEGEDLITTFSEIKHRRTATLWGKTALWVVKDWLRFGFYGEVFHRFCQDDAHGKSAMWGFEGSAALGLYLPKKWKIEVNALYNTPQKDLFYRTSHLYFLGAALQKDFGKRCRLRVSVPYILLNRKSEKVSLIEGVDYKALTTRWFRRVDISFVYNFGSALARNRSRQTYGVDAVKERATTEK